MYEAYIAVLFGFIVELIMVMAGDDDECTR